MGTSAVPSAAMAGGGDGGGVYPSVDGPLDGEGGPLWLAPLAAAAMAIKVNDLNGCVCNPRMTPDRPQTDGRTLRGQRGQWGAHRSNIGVQSTAIASPVGTSLVPRLEGPGPWFAPLFAPPTLRAATSSRNLAFTSA